MNKKLLVILIFGILILLTFSALYFIITQKTNNNIQNNIQTSFEDWREQAIVKYCMNTGMNVTYINEIPVCYDPKTDTYVAYSLILEEVIKECVKNSCSCPDFINSGNPEILEGNRGCIIFFWGKGCPHCAREKPILENLHKKYNITIYMYEVYYSEENRELFRKVTEKLNVPGGVPLTIVGNYTFIGVLGDDELRYIFEFLS